MTCAAVSGGSAIRSSAAETSMSHTKSGIRPSVMPGHRMDTAVARRLTAVAVVPTPLKRMPRIQ